MLKKFALVIGSVLVTLLVLEIALRVYLVTLGTDDQKVLYLYNRQEIEAMVRRFEGTAYLNFMLSPVRDEHNALGYRGEDIVQPKPEDVFRIVTLGGSTTYGEFIEDNAQTYPAQLERELRETHGFERVEVINAGVPAYTSWESLVNLQFRVLDLEPDLIIIYHGVNDINPRLSDPATYSGHNAARGYWKGDDEPIPVSSLYRFALVRLGWEPPVSLKIESQFVQPEGTQNCGLAFEEGVAICANYDMTAEEVMAANPPIYFERNIRNMIHSARGQGVEVMLASWAYSPHDYDFPGGTFMTEPFRQAAIAEHNQVIENIASDLEVAYYDFVADMPTDTQYWIDGQHVNGSGAMIQAEQFAAFIVENGLLSDG